MADEMPGNTPQPDSTSSPTDSFPDPLTDGVAPRSHGPDGLDGVAARPDGTDGTSVLPEDVSAEDVAEAAANLAPLG